MPPSTTSSEKSAKIVDIARSCTNEPPVKIIYLKNERRDQEKYFIKKVYYRTRMTPSQHIESQKEEKERQAKLAENWHHPLSKGSNKLSDVLESMKEFKLAKEEVPLIIKLTENPN